MGIKSYRSGKEIKLSTLKHGKCPLSKYKVDLITERQDKMSTPIVENLSNWLQPVLYINTKELQILTQQDTNLYYIVVLA